MGEGIIKVQDKSCSFV